MIDHDTQVTDDVNLFARMVEQIIEAPYICPTLSPLNKATLMVQWALGPLARISQSAAERLALASIAGHLAPDGSMIRAEASAEAKAALDEMTRCQASTTTGDRRQS